MKYREYAIQAVEEFKNTYSKCGNLENFVKRGGQEGYEIINEYVEILLKDLIQKEIYHMTKDTIENNYGNMYLKEWCEAFEDIQNQYMEIQLKGEELAAYRKARRENRARWSGGGFGIDGAIKGAATAGALNAVSGIFHGIVYAGSRLIDTAMESSQKRTIYENKENQKKLADSIFWGVLQLHRVWCDLLKIEQMPISAEKSKALFENLARIDNQNKVKELLAQIIYLDPYNEKVYQYAFQHFGDSNGELQRTAEYFGVAQGLTSLKYEQIKNEYYKKESYQSFAKIDKVLDELRELKKEYGSSDSDIEIQQEIDKEICTIDDSLFSTITEINKDLDKLQVLKKEYGILNITLPEEQHLLEIRQKINEEIRTVDGILFSTIEEANVARKDLRRIYRIEQEVDYTDLNSIAKGEQEITRCTTTLLKESHLDCMHQKRISLDKELRTVNGKVFPTKEEADIEREKLELVMIMFRFPNLR